MQRNKGELMRILHLIYSFNIGGAERIVVELANQQVENNEVGVCIINNLYSEQLLGELKHNVLIKLIGRKKGSRNIVDVLRLNLFIHWFKPDILHVHDSDAILYIPFRKSYTSILTIHATGLPLKGTSRYTQLVAVSQSVAYDIRMRGLGNPFVIYNGISINNISTRPLQKSFIKRNEFRIIQIGRLEHLLKGQHIVLYALQHIKWKNVHVDFIGTGRSIQYLHQLTEQLGLRQQISFLGEKSKEWIYAHLTEYDLLLQPSISEGFGLTVTEAMAARVPVLTSDLPAIMEITDGGKFGYHFSCGNAQSLSNAILHIIDHYSDAIQRANEAKEHVKKCFDAKIMARHYIDLYSSYISPR